MSNLKKNIIFSCVGLGFVLVFGALSHFFYEWSGYNEIVGFLFPANESTWEHLKLSIFPTFIFFIFGSFFMKSPNYIFAMFITLLTPIILIPLVFYGYTAISGSSILVVDIITFLISVSIAWLFCFLILQQKKLNKWFNIIGIIGILIILVCYLTFTINPPQIFLFKDPITGGYGLKS